MGWGDHYVFCAVSGKKILRSEAVLDEEGKWVHKDLLLQDLQDRRRHTPHIMPVYPKIIRKPQVRFRDQIDTWDTIDETWETISENWENK